jgi:hypothetical protein
MIVPTPAGSWGLGPALLYLIGLVVALAWFGVSGPRRPREPTPEERAEQRKRAKFDSLMKAGSRRF